MEPEVRAVEDKQLIALGTVPLRNDAKWIGAVDCCSRFFIGTNLICGRCTASQMAAASAASFLPRLPLMRYGVTSFGATKRTVSPAA